MSITISLTPEAAAELQRQAAAAGTDVTSFVLTALKEKLTVDANVSAENRSYDEWSTDFHRWVGSHPSRNPRFDDSRNSIYE